MLAAIVLERNQPVRVVEVRGHNSGHERRWVMCLEVRSLVRKHSVRGRMRLVESVTGKLLHQVENACCCLLRNAAFRRPGHEYLALFRHFLRLLLTHCASQQVSTAQRVSGEHLRDLHHLFLVQNDAVGFLQRRLEVGMQVVDIILVDCMPVRDEVIDHARLQRARPEQRDKCDEVIEAIRSHALYEVAHTAGFELKHCGRLRTAQ